MLCLAVFADGTGDDGDSVGHYLIAHYAFKHPYLLLDHWGKPVFTLLAAPFAYWGFTGIKLFNVALATATLWLTYRSACLLNIPSAWAAILLLATSPMYVSLNLSGLTEPLLGFTLMLSLYWALCGRWAWAAVLMSFAPLVRSEGIIMLGVFAIYLLVKRRYAVLPYLALGQALYSVVGYPYYGDWLWVFRRIPYATLSSGYGSGQLNHFAAHLHELIGNLGVFWLLLGLLSGFIRSVLYILRRSLFLAEECWLVYGGFVAFFVAHSLFWYWGIFVSAGLVRVLLSVIPLIAIISLRGIQGFTARLPALRVYGKTPVLLILCLITVLESLSRLRWERDFAATPAHKTLIEAAQWTKQHYGAIKTAFYDAMYSSVAFDIDPFTQTHSLRQVKVGGYIEDHSLLIWDSFFARTQNGLIELDALKQDPRLSLLKCFEQSNKYIGKREVCLFERKAVPDSVRNILLDDQFETASPLRDTLYAHSGQRSLRVGNPDAFSSGIEPMLATFPPDCKAIRATVWVYSPNPKPAAPPKLVLTYDNFWQSIQWSDLPLKDLEPNTWQRFELEVPMLKDIPLNIDRLKAFVWNPTDQPVWIDDFRVELLR